MDVETSKRIGKYEKFSHIDKINIKWYILYMKNFKFKFMLQERNGNMTDMKRLLEEVEELRSENEKLRNENSDLKYELENLKKECAKLHAKVKNS